MNAIRREPDEVDAAGDLPVGVVPAVPHRRMAAGRQVGRDQLADATALDVEDRQVDRSRVGQVEGDGGLRVEGIRLRRAIRVASGRSSATGVDGESRISR